MPEILTESFCERCGTRYTFESATPRGPRLKGLKVMSRGLKNFVLSDDTSMDEAMAAARNETDREQTSQQLDAFHKTFNFCMSCRQYTCGNCWNEAEGRCLSCAPHLGHDVLPAPFSNLGAGGAVTLTDNEAIGLNDRNGHAEPAAATAPSEPMAWPEPEPMAWPTSDLMHEQEPAGPSSFQEAIDAAARLEAVSGPMEAAPAEDVELPGAIEAAADVEEPLILADTIENELAAYEREQAAAAGAAMAAAAEAAAAQAEAEEAAAARARAEEAATAQARAQEAAEAAAAQARAEQIAAAAAAEARAVEEAEAAAAHARAAEAAAAQAREEEEAAAQARAQEAAEATAAQAKAEEAAAAAAAQARAQEAAEAAAAQARAEEVAAAQARAREEAEAAAAQARADEEAAAAAAADEARDDLVFQPTWQIVAPEPPTTDQLPPATPPAAAPAAPPDTIAASAEPQWPAEPEWPRAPSADGLPFLGRPTAATGGIEALWAESAREVANVGPATSPKAMGGVQPCVSCGLSLSANARFCRRCGTRQG